MCSFEQAPRLLVHLAALVVVRARDDDDRVEFRERRDHVAAVAAHEPGVGGAARRLVDAVPEAVPVVLTGERIALDGGGGGHERRGDDRLAGVLALDLLGFGHGISVNRQVADAEDLPRQIPPAGSAGRSGLKSGRQTRETPAGDRSTAGVSVGLPTFWSTPVT